MKQHERIVRDPKVMLGKPVIRGTRITVEHIPQELGGGLAPEQIVAGYPHLTLEDIRAAQAYAADYMADEEVAYGQADFGELVSRQRVAVPGLILLRLTTADPQRKAERLLTAITAHGERLHGQHLVVLDSSVRWRPLLAAI